jgi:acetate kinase
MAGLEPQARRVLSSHLGGSSSICAIVDGRSVDSTMGFSPQSGLPQAERTGDLDAFALAHVVTEGVTLDEATRALATESGLLGLSGLSGDLRELEQAEQQGDERAAFAMSVYAYQARKAIGALAAAMRGVDAIAFTGGMGEHSSRLRERVCDGLDFLGVRLDAERNRGSRPADEPGSVHSAGAPVAVWVVPADEERILVREALAFL